jgi:hypothetical protein
VSRVRPRRTARAGRRQFRGPSAALSIFVVASLLLPASAAAVTPDRDGDGLRDGFEQSYGVTDPNRKDSDWDGVINAAEDSDGDYLSDRGEQRFGLDPGDPDSDDDGVRDGQEDHDGDGCSNLKEQDQRPLPKGVRPARKDARDDSPNVGKRCGSPLLKSKLVRCHFGNPKSDTTVVLMGDSHATAYVEAAKRAAEAEGWHLVTLLKGACAPLLGVYTMAMRNRDGGRTCRTWRKEAIEWLNARRKAPDAILLTHSDSSALAHTDGSKVSPEAKVPIWANGLRKTLRAMPEASKVIVLGDVPKNKLNPVRCLKWHPKDMSRCSSPWQPLSARTVELAMRDVALNEGQYPRTLYEQLCPYAPCPVVQGDVLMWRDKTHLTGTFARRLTPSFRKVIRNVLNEPA